MDSSRAVQVVQISDTHFVAPGGELEGGFGYDTAAAFDAVFDHMAARWNTGSGESLDSTASPGEAALIVATGDIADHGRVEEYRAAADAFSRFSVPVNVTPGNHDSYAAYHANLGRPGIGTSRVLQLSNWAFVFVDSNAGVMQADHLGLLTDPEYDSRLHSNGLLGEREAAWVARTVKGVDAEHVFVWLHHPPVTHTSRQPDHAYRQEWKDLVRQLPNIRGFGAGHTHIPLDLTLEGVPVFVAPSLKHNFSLDPQTWLPPGYRTYQFHADGTIDSQVHLVEADERWPRRPFGRALRSLLDGTLSYDEFGEIVARAAARNAR